jgi:phosphonoacetate hydrolase
VILPITDPYVVHHGALGSFATVYLPPGADTGAAIGRLSAVKGVQMAISNAEACARFELPADRLGDVVVISDKHVVLGTSRARHDLSGLDAPLRSHGGISEQTVPLMFNRRTAGMPGKARMRNFDILDVALNHLEP